MTRLVMYYMELLFKLLDIRFEHELRAFINWMYGVLLVCAFVMVYTVTEPNVPQWKSIIAFINGAAVAIMIGAAQMKVKEIVDKRKKWMKG